MTECGPFRFAVRSPTCPGEGLVGYRPCPGMHDVERFRPGEPFVSLDRYPHLVCIPAFDTHLIQGAPVSHTPSRWRPQPKTKRARRRDRQARKPKCHLRVEALEDRVVPVLGAFDVPFAIDPYALPGANQNFAGVA